MKRTPEARRAAAKKFVMEALALLWGSPSTAKSDDEAIAEIDAELRALDRQQQAGKVPWRELRPHGTRVLTLLIDRYHLSNQTYLGTGFGLVAALRTLDKPRVSVHPLLKKRSALGDVPTWEEDCRNWATAYATAAILVLEACCELTEQSASEAVAEALSDTSYRSSSGSTQSPKAPAVVKWAGSALNSDGSDREILHHAIWDLMLSLDVKSGWKELPQLPTKSITKALQMTIDALLPRA